MRTVIDWLREGKEPASLQNAWNAAQREVAEQLQSLAQAAIDYDAAIRSCADDPNRMSSFCTAAGDDLDTLYMRWIGLAREVLNNKEPTNGSIKA